MDAFHTHIAVSVLFDVSCDVLGIKGLERWAKRMAVEAAR